MALVPSDEYPAQTDIDTDYPQGKARNASSFQDGTGTPFEAKWLNDIWGFLQALLRAARVTPSGDADTAVASQYLDAVRVVANDAVLPRHLRSAMQMRQLNLNGTTPDAEQFMGVARTGDVGSRKTLLVKGEANGVFRFADASLADLRNVTAGGLGECRAVAYSGSRHMAIGGVAVYSTNGGTSWTNGGSLGVMATPRYIVWDGTEFIVASTSSSAHSTNGVAWSTPSGGSDIDDVAAGTIGGLAVLTPGTVVATAGDGAIAITTNHGVSWGAGTSVPHTIVGGAAFRALVGRGEGEVLWFGQASFGEGPIECWASSDGSTWTQRASVTDHPDGGANMRALICQETGLVVVASSFAYVSVSADGGRTWTPAAVYDSEATFDPAAIGVAHGRIWAAAGDRMFATDPLL